MHYKCACQSNNKNNRYNQEVANKEPEHWTKNQWTLHVELLPNERFGNCINQDEARTEYKKWRLLLERWMTHRMLNFSTIFQISGHVHIRVVGDSRSIGEIPDIHVHQRSVSEQFSVLETVLVGLLSGQPTSGLSWHHFQFVLVVKKIALCARPQSVGRWICSSGAEMHSEIHLSSSCHHLSSRNNDLTHPHTDSQYLLLS